MDDEIEIWLALKFLPRSLFIVSLIPTPIYHLLGNGEKNHVGLRVGSVSLAVPNQLSTRLSNSKMLPVIRFSFLGFSMVK